METWVTVDESSLAPDDAAIFHKRASAIKLYAGGASLRQVTSETGISTKDLYRFLDRCEGANQDGRKNGWRGIIPHEHLAARQITSNNRGINPGYANAFARFLNTYPTIKENLISLAKKGWRVDEKGPQRKLSFKKIHAEMLTDCRKAGLGVADYPLCVASHAYSSVRNFVRRVRQEEAIRTFPAGGISDLPLVTRCYQRFEVDGHKDDLICTVEIPSPTSRGVVYMPIERLWLIPVIEGQSTAALGYAIAYGLNYSGADVVRAIRHATLPWKPMELTTPGLAYSRLGGFPSGVDSALAYVCCDEVLLDNHKGHLSLETCKQIHKVLGATPVYGCIDNQNARACAEGFFRLLELRLHELPSSTGSNPKTKPVKDPKANAIKYQITDQHITECAEVALARYNSEKPPGSSLSRIEILQRYVNDPRSLVRRIPLVQRDKITLYDTALKLTIHGDEQNGVRPYVYWLESRYTNPVIASTYGLIGTTLTCYADSIDIRKLKAYFPSGADAGELICERRFRGTAHSMTTRKHANKNRRHEGCSRDSSGDEIAGYTKHVTKNAATSKHAATELARIKAEARSRPAHPSNTPCDAANCLSSDEKKVAVEPDSIWERRLKDLGTQF